ncbi:dehydrogenase [Streptomyces sparsogenes DSM 40356]|uniref:Dehydrogenase n=1 Tax=Streptomyces sparsogenes DSM 40356 TaxID=1331668 RepID=A0A1R1S599_9ACTN|nr:dehydrogenase [Streptomyces sparsogenes DSM 40356]
MTAWQPLVRVAEIRAGQRGLVHAAGGGIGQRGVLLDARGTGPDRDPIRARAWERGLRYVEGRRDQPSSPGGVPQLVPPGPSNPTELMKSR